MAITSKPLSIEVFLVNGNPEGMLTATIPFQWTGHILVFKRPELEKALAREETKQPGFYLLMGDDAFLYSKRATLDKTRCLDEKKYH